MPNFDQVKAGQPLQIPAATYNELITLLKWWRALGPGARQPAQRVRELDVVLMKNNAGEGLPIGHVLGLDEPLFTPDDDVEEFKFRSRMKGVMPDRSTHYRKFAVLLEPADEGELVEAAVDGLVVALLDVVDEEHTHADVVDGETLLRSNVAGGALILWKETGVGEKWAIVQLGPPATPRLCQATATIPGNSSTTDYIVLTGDTPGSETDSGITEIPDAYHYLTSDLAEDAIFALHEGDGGKLMILPFAAGEGDGDGHQLGKANELIAAGTAGSVNIYTGTPGAETDTEVAITPFNRTSAEIPNGGWVHIIKINGHKYCEPWSCGV